MGKKQTFRYWLETPDGRIYQDPVGGAFLYGLNRDDAETRLISRARAREARGLGPFNLRSAPVNAVAAK